MLIADKWLRDMPQQFLEKKNIEVLVKAFARQMQEVKQAFDDMNAELDLDSAVGQNLDYVGTIIPLTRKEAGELAGMGDTEPVMSDERYRQYLRYKLLVNTNECTYYDLMDGLALLWDVAPVYYIEDPALPATIILTMPFLQPGGKPVPLGEVPMIKPAGVRIEFEYRIRTAIEVMVKWLCLACNVPLCGTFLCGTYPRRGTLGKIISVGTQVEIDGIRKIFDQILCGTMRIGGVMYDSTTGRIITDSIETVINSDFRTGKLISAGGYAAGVYPVRSTKGTPFKSGIEAGSVVSATKVKLYRSGTRTVGGGQTEPPAAEIISNSIDVGSAVSHSSTNAPKCGSGKEVKTVTAGKESITVEPSVIIAATKTRKCGGAVCGNK